MNAEYYFICDNKWLEHKILKSCVFPDKRIKFIPSIRKHNIKNVKNLYSGYWMNATYAHLTPFLHAKKKGHCSFWSIDADDTYLLMNPCRCVNAFNLIRDYSLSYGLDIISLDMWLSRTKAQHWSFGITYINNRKVDFVEIFKKVDSQDWMDYYKDMETAFNLDWFITYLRDMKKVNVGSFYIDNCWFIHFGNFILNPFYGWINYWENDFIHYPILEFIYNNKTVGCLPIANGTYRLDVGASKDEGMALLENRICKSRYFKGEQRKLFNNEEFANNKNYFRI